MDFSQMTVRELHQYAMGNPETPYAKELVDALIKTEDAEMIFYAGQFWSDHIYSKRLFDQLVQMKSIEYLYQIYNYWMDDRYSNKELAMALCEHGRTYEINYMIKFLPKDCYDEELVDAVMKNNDCRALYNLIEKWPDEKYNEEIGNKFIDRLKYLIETTGECNLKMTFFFLGERLSSKKYDKRMLDIILNDNNDASDDPFALGWIVERWDEDRFDRKRVVEKLLTYDDVETILLAVKRWPKKHYDEMLINYLIDNSDSYDLCEIVMMNSVDLDLKIVQRMFKKMKSIDRNLKGFETLFDNISYEKNVDEKAIIYIVHKMFEQKSFETLYNIGMNWRDSLFIPSIGHYLYRSGSAEHIQTAQKHWPKDRLQYLCKPKIVVNY